MLPFPPLPMSVLNNSALLAELPAPDSPLAMAFALPNVPDACALPIACCVFASDVPVAVALPAKAPAAPEPELMNC